MNEACLTPRQLVDALFKILSGEPKRHLATCRACARRLSLLRRVRTVGCEDVATVTDEVDLLVSRLYSTPRNRWWRTLQQPEYHRGDVVRRLATVADQLALSNRKLAIALITAATRLLPTLPDDLQGVCDLRFDTWKLASALLREAGQYQDTEVALANAALAAKNASDPELAEAFVDFYRALLLAEPDVWRPDEASELLERIEPVFRRVAARHRALLTARALLLHRDGHLREALVLFETILAGTPLSDGPARLNSLSNVVAARVELGEIGDDVERHLEALIDENTALGRTVQEARARWLKGRLHRLRKEYAESESLLTSAMREIGDIDSMIRIGLDLLETLLLDDRYTTAIGLARTLAADAISLDQREPTRRHALTAAVLTYAREAAQRGALTADLVSELSMYVDRISRQRATDFIPPLPLADM